MLQNPEEFHNDHSLALLRMYTAFSFLYLGWKNGHFLGLDNWFFIASKASNKEMLISENNTSIILETTVLCHLLEAVL